METQRSTAVSSKTYGSTLLPAQQFCFIYHSSKFFAYSDPNAKSKRWCYSTKDIVHSRLKKPDTVVLVVPFMGKKW